MSQDVDAMLNAGAPDPGVIDAALRRLGVEPGSEEFVRLSRRGLLGAMGGLAVLALAGCQGSGGSVGALPGPVWPDSGEGPTPPRPSVPGPSAPARDTASIPTGVIPRSQWTRAGVARPNEINPMNGIRRITVHHDGISGAVGTSEGAAKSRLESVRQSHVSGRGWADIGYHYVIDPAGRVWAARDVRFQGAHVKDNNENNLGVMVMGNFDEQRPTPQALATLDRFVAQSARQYGVPVSRIYTHQEINPTACPGRNLQAYMVKTRARGGSMASAMA